MYLKTYLISKQNMLWKLAGLRHPPVRMAHNRQDLMRHKGMAVAQSKSCVYPSIARCTVPRYTGPAECGHWVRLDFSPSPPKLSDLTPNP
jgi:hypothetical protein